MNQFERVRDDPDLVKDSKTRIIINTNSSSYAAYKRKREELKKAASIEEEVKQLKADVASIKDMMSLILESIRDGKSNS